MRKGFRIVKFKNKSPSLEVRGLTKSFDGRTILEKIDLKLMPGMVLGLLGPNGSGKSTLFNSILGLHNIDNGKIFVNGKNITEVPIHKRSEFGIGYLTQNNSLFGSLTVFDNLYGITQLKMRDDKKRRDLVERLLDEFQLRSIKNLKAENLSGGQAKRVSIARLMINSPNVVLMDEPCSSLDPITSEEVSKYILKLQKDKGVSILVTEHNVKNIFDIADKIMLLGENRIIAEGSPSEILKSSKAKELYFGSSYNS
jgi:lipopolysaccharide export system ATP-binding protein|tara:strand:+ start:1047 stop:1811 length:765 start_codon:yes stop_codon:yes gene_type:complete